MFISPNLLMIMPKIKYCLPLTYLSMDKNKTKTKNAETQFSIKNNFTIILPRFFFLIFSYFLNSKPTISYYI